VNSTPEPWPPRRPAVGAAGGDVDHGRADLLEGGDHAGRVRVERVLVGGGGVRCGGAVERHGGVSGSGCAATDVGRGRGGDGPAIRPGIVPDERPMGRAAARRHLLRVHRWETRR
jgi:hypothetical protein